MKSIYIIFFNYSFDYIIDNSKSKIKGSRKIVKEFPVFDSKEEVEEFLKELEFNIAREMLDEDFIHMDNIKVSITNMVKVS
jgi:hypothetical protein